MVAGSKIIMQYNAGTPCGLVDLAHKIDDAGVDTDVGETDGMSKRGTI